MKLSSLCLLSLALCLPVPPLPNSAFAARPPRAEEPSPEFRDKFLKALQLNAKGEMVKLVKTESDAAIALAVRTGDVLLEQPTDEARVLLKALGEAWKTAFKSEFVHKLEAWCSTIEEGKKKDQKELKQRFEAAKIEFENNQDRKDGLVFANLVDEIEILAAGFEEVGDDYRAAQAWSTYAACYDEDLRGESADLPRAQKGYQRAIDAYARLDLKDKNQERVAKRVATLAARAPDAKKAAPPPTDEVPSGPAFDPNASSGATITSPLAFEALPSIEAFQRPCYSSDEIYPLWPAIVLQAKGSTSNLPYYDAAPPVVRVGSSDVRVDLDRDGQGDEKLPLTNTLAPFQFAFDVNGVKRQWAFFAMTGIEKDNYQGIEVNLAPTDSAMTIYTLSAASVVGQIGETPVRLIDDFPDGMYGTRPQTWGHPGMSREHFQPEMDSIVIGASKRARPWSDIQQIAGAWYRLEVDADAKELKATPIAPPTGVLKLDYKGPAPSWLVVKNTAENTHLYYDLVEGGAKGVAVPVGTYALYYGEIRKGKKRQVQKVAIVPGGSSPTYAVKSGETTVVELGGPYGFAFKTVKDGENVTVEGPTVAVVGAKGERYERPWNCVSSPEVSWRKAGTKKATKVDQMKLVRDSQGINDHGWAATWLPLDFAFEARGAGEGVEVQLSDKKHALFGKVESDWK